MSSGGLSLAEVAEVCGVETVEKLTKQAGGCQLYVAQHPGEHTRIGKILGAELARKFVDHFGYGAMIIPLGNESAVRVRYATFIDLLNRGRSIGQIAREMRVARRTVERWRAKYYGRSGAS